jgi:hypothetical protein
MPLTITNSAPTLFFRQAAYERSGLTRAALDERLNLTADEFRAERGLVAIGPIVDPGALGELVDDLEQMGLVYFEDFFDLSGNWPDWLRLYVSAAGE